jgi:MFS family permease
MLAWVIGQYGWLAAFGTLAVAGVIWSAIWLVAGKEGPYTSHAAEIALDGAGNETAGQETRHDAPDSSTRVPYLRTILTPTWIFSVLAAFCAYWTFTVAMSWGPAYFETVLKVTSQEAGTLIALPAAWGAIATVGLSALTQRLHIRGVPTRRSRSWVLGAGTILSGATLLGAVYTPNPVVAIGLMVVGFGTAPALFVITPLIVSELTTAAQRGANLSIAIAFFTAGGLFAPAVSGFIIGGSQTAATGYATAFAFAGALTLGSGLLCFLFANQQRERRRLGIEGESIATVPVHG